MEEKKLTGYPSIDKPWLKYYSEEALHAPLPQCTVFELLWNNNKDHLGDTALNYYGRKITYEQLFAGIERAAKSFFRTGCESRADRGDLYCEHTRDGICVLCPEPFGRNCQYG